MSQKKKKFILYGNFAEKEIFFSQKKIQNKIKIILKF